MTSGKDISPLPNDHSRWLIPESVVSRFPERRFACVRVPFGYSLKCIKLPDGCKLVSSRPDMAHNFSTHVIHHDSFDVVLPGCSIPLYKSDMAKV